MDCSIAITVEFISLLILNAPLFAITAILFTTLLGKLPDKVDQLLNHACMTVNPRFPFMLFYRALGFWRAWPRYFLSTSLLVAAVLILIIAKLVLTVARVGAGLHGGSYLTPLFMGAGVGCLLGTVAATLGIASGAGLSIAGMAAVVAAVFGTPI